MQTILLITLAFLATLQQVQAESNISENEEILRDKNEITSHSEVIDSGIGYCEKDGGCQEGVEESPADKYRYEPGLARLEGYEIGHKQVVQLEDNKNVTLITKAMKPLLFEIPNFLSNDEIETIIRRAQDPDEGGMAASRAKGGLTKAASFKPTGKSGKATGRMGNFTVWDVNRNNIVTVDEIISIAHARASIFMQEADVLQMFKDLELSALDDGKITRKEFEELNTIGIDDYINRLHFEDPRFKERHSDQAWLFMHRWLDPVIHDIRERVVKITGLPRLIVYGGEQLQVVRYQPHGHYNAHHDSETHLRSDIPCCHQYEKHTLDAVGECKLCRYLTFLMYLNDVDEGGETAFPIADEEKYVSKKLRSTGNPKHDKYNMVSNCKNAKLLIKPEKGKAVMWYNHLLNDTNGWMGELDMFSLHGGCAIEKGEKWIANMWLTAPYYKDRYEPSIYLNMHDYEDSEEYEQLKKLKQKT